MSRITHQAAPIGIAAQNKAVVYIRLRPRCASPPPTSRPMLYNALLMGKKPHKLPLPLGIFYPARGGPSHGHRQTVQKFGKNRACGSGDVLADRQTQRQTCSSQYFETAPAGEVIRQRAGDGPKL